LPYRRALLIGAIGPTVFTLGLVWTVVRLLLTDPALSLRAIAFAPAHQMMFVGAAVSVVCLPVAFAVARAKPEELALPGFEARLHSEPPPGRDAADRQGRRSYQGYN
jgi:hypothetical protein